jgi:hypothetical protein
VLDERKRSMKRILYRILGAAAALAMTASACTTTSTDAGTPATAPFPVNFDLSIFDENSANITNEWWPLKPGNQWLWEGQALDGEEKIRRRLIFTVTDLTKEIAGVRTLVGWDRDYNNEILVEQELVFFAQDKKGNIWHFGQSVEIYDDEGALEGGQTWLVGYLEGAKAGIILPAKQELGSPEYSQGYAPPPYYWNDVAKLAQTGQRICVPAGCFNDVAVIEEYEPMIDDAFQLKYFARGVGNIKTGWRGAGEEEKEELDLIRKRDLTPDAMTLVRAEALRLEARANVYGFTKKLQTRPAIKAAAAAAK